jgi:tyrosine-specific transport protein
MSKAHQSNILTVSFLITGNSVGSGLLALPICVGLAGVIPGIVVIIISCCFMTITGLVLAGLVNSKRSIDFDLPSIYGNALGDWFKWIAVSANLIVLYGLLVAYLSCLTTIANATFGIDFAFLPLVIFVIITSVNFFAINIIKNSNTVFVILLFLSFIFLLIFTGKNINIVNYKHTNWLLIFISLPVLVNSFNFHNMVPIVCRLLNYDKKRSFTAIILGVTFSFILNLFWCIAVVGVLNYSIGGNNSILYSFKHNLPATVPLAKIIHSTTFNIVAVLFATIAVVTSYWTVGAALTSFIKDLRNSCFPRYGTRTCDLLLTFCPPLIITLICSNIFISIQDVIGGVGIAVLFGILPSYILFKKSHNFKRGFAVILICFFLFVFIFALIERFGVIHLI